MSDDKIVRIKLRDECFRKYKVFCAIADITMTDMTNRIIKEYVDEQEKIVKIVKIERK